MKIMGYAAYVWATPYQHFSIADQRSGGPDGPFSTYLCGCRILGSGSYRSRGFVDNMVQGAPQMPRGRSAICANIPQQWRSGNMEASAKAPCERFVVPAPQPHRLGALCLRHPRHATWSDEDWSNTSGLGNLPTNVGVYLGANLECASQTGVWRGAQ